LEMTFLWKPHEIKVFWNILRGIFYFFKNYFAKPFRTYFCL
jgi:hypothetical protein